ncbi:cell envelope integrity protein TolA [Lysobacter pythonis]|uniref:Cell envelope integrity protein TolA n=1 Tax=Solilutibacter pythonis TaxID=2483112 RepID=A0A3M2I1U2_9GAMM|nr:cell envelope integrity protein TolA [Lysobacter pythonis]RMH94133.1 cell envelope integrity protein TolA [Lysobacter pythonis]
MRETRADTARAVAFALGLHALLAVLVFAGLHWVRKRADPAGGGPVVEAEMVDAGALSAKMRRALASRAPVEVEVTPEPLPRAMDEAVEEAPPLPQPEPEPEPQEAAVPPRPAPQAPLAQPDTREQDEARREAIDRETREREQEEKRRQEQIELQHRQAQAQAEQKRRLAARQQAEAKAKADAEAKAKADKEAREQRALELAAARAQQQADAQARVAARAAASNPGPAAGAGQGKDTRAEWLALVVGEIEKQWRRPDDIPRGQRCPIRIKLLPGGEVLSAEVQPSCPYSEQNRRTVEAAVKKASPLPLKGNEDLALRDFVVNFFPSR